MKANIDLSAVADQLEDCQPGDEYSLVFVVDSKSDKGLTGTASSIDHLEEEGYADEEPEDQMTHGPIAKGPKLPKAILMVAK